MMCWMIFSSCSACSEEEISRLWAEIQQNLGRRHATADGKDRGANAGCRYPGKFFVRGSGRALGIQARHESESAVDLRRFIPPSHEVLEVPGADIEIDSLGKRHLPGDVLDCSAANEIVRGIEIACGDTDFCGQATLCGPAHDAEKIKWNDGSGTRRYVPFVRTTDAAELDRTHHQWPVIAFLRLGQVFQDAEHTVELLLLLRDLAGNLFELLLLTQKLLLHRLSLHRPKKEKNWNQHNDI